MDWQAGRQQLTKISTAIVPLSRCIALSIELSAESSAELSVDFFEFVPRFFERMFLEDDHAEYFQIVVSSLTSCPAFLTRSPIYWTSAQIVCQIVSWPQD